jgi:hypothetical protein
VSKDESDISAVAKGLGVLFVFLIVVGVLFLIPLLVLYMILEGSR